MKKKRIVSLSLIVALIAIIAGGTYAYFTDNTGTATNTFTVGNIAIELTESKTTNGGRKVVEKDKDKLVDGTFTGNDYHLVPGVTYIKDPKVRVIEGSEPSYVFVKVENQLDEFVNEQLELQMVENDWERVVLPTGEFAENVWGYKSIVEAPEEPEELPVFSGFKIDPEANRDDLEGNQGKNIIINAFAIQAEGFEDADAAWNALNK